VRVLLNAVPFGYGPTSKCASIARELLTRGVECVFAGSGVAYEFFARERLCECIYLDVYQPGGEV
jgi:UDP:flavonoid glycosyltransferase YjiC (YdhE family)